MAPDSIANVPLAEALKVEKLDSHTYRVNLSKAFCIGAGESLTAGHGTASSHR